MGLFTMRVKDTFHLEGGTTAFIGVLETHARTIPPCDCQIIVNNEVKMSLRIDGEMILQKQQAPCRAISSSQRIDLASFGVGRGGFTIRSKD